MNCLTFNTEVAANLAQSVIWENFLDAVVNAGGIERVRFGGGSVSGETYADMSSAQKRQCELCGVIGGAVEETGRTVKYADPLKIHGQSQWWMAAPPPELLAGVVGYTEADFSESWMPAEIQGAAGRIIKPIRGVRKR